MKMNCSSDISIFPIKSYMEKKMHLNTLINLTISIKPELGNITIVYTE